MKNLIAFVFVAGLASSAVQAMPVAPEKNAAGIIINVANGCGRGFDRDGYGRCVAVYVPRYRYRGPCDGRGQHRVYDVYGRPMMVCN